MPGWRSAAFGISYWQWPSRTISRKAEFQLRSLRSRHHRPQLPGNQGIVRGERLRLPSVPSKLPPSAKNTTPTLPLFSGGWGRWWCDPIVMESMSWHLRGGKGSLHGDVNGKTKRGPSAPPSTDKGQHPFPHSLRLPDAGRHHQDRIVPRHRAHHLRPALLVDRPRHLPRMGRRRLQNQ